MACVQREKSYGNDVVCPKGKGTRVGGEVIDL